MARKRSEGRHHPLRRQCPRSDRCDQAENRRDSARASKGSNDCSFYDRGILIDHAVDTLRHALIEEIILVTFAHVLFLWHFRSILVVTIPLPLAC